MKKIFKYILIFVITVMLLFSALILSSKIPHSAIEENLKESIEFYKKKSGIHRINKKHVYTFIHYFADTRKLNIIYCLDSEKPIESTLWAKYFQEIKADTNKDFIKVVEESHEPNTEYLRYWNGCMLFLRPLLTIYNMQQIYLINKIVLAILVSVLFIMLYRRSKKLAIIFILSLILVAVWYVPLCIEYSVMFYVMLITSIIAIAIDKGKNNKENKSKDVINEKLSCLFLVNGVVATFLDFLTTEILTIFVPLLLILIIRKEESRADSLKDTFKFIIKASILWFMGYAGMWIAKWILASLILHMNAFNYVSENFMLRVNGLQGLNSYETLYGNVIGRNLFAIPLLDIINQHHREWYVKMVVLIVIMIIFAVIDWKEVKTKKYLLPLIVIACVPYLRYLILANHSYRHAMFTFRDQIITIIVVLYIIVECLNYKLLYKKISYKKKK